MANVHLTDWKHKELPVNTKVDGASHDTCPNCGTRDVEPSYTPGGAAGRDRHHIWSLYCHDRRKGGCGHTWTRTDRRRAQVERARGLSPLHLTSSGEVGRTTFTPTETYSANYERIFKHK